MRARARTCAHIRAHARMHTTQTECHALEFLKSDNYETRYKQYSVTDLGEGISDFFPFLENEGEMAKKISQ